MVLGVGIKNKKQKTKKTKNKKQQNKKTKNQKTKKIMEYVVFAAGAKVLYDHFRAYGESRWLLFAAVCVLCAAATYEARELGCRPGACTIAHNREAQSVVSASVSASMSGSAAMCAESRRVTWRVSYMLAFAVFTVLNVQRVAPRENLTALVATWAIAQGVFGFLAYHRFGIWCVGGEAPSLPPRPQTRV
jgi:hypothetical protein